MKKLLFVLASLMLLFASCSKSPEDRAKSVVKDYVKAIQNGDKQKVENLTCATYDIKVGACIYVDDEDVYHIDLPIECVFDKNEKLNISSVSNIYTAPTAQEKAMADSIAAMNNFNPQKTNWPNTAKAVYEVTVDTNGKTAVFTVIKTGEKVFKIYNSSGFYRCNIKDFEEKRGYKITLPEANDDVDLAQIVNRMILTDIRFTNLLNAVAANDSTMLSNIFSPHKYTFKTKPKPIYYLQTSDGTSIIECADSTAYRFDSSSKLSDVRGIISADEAQNSVKEVGGIPWSRDGRFDREYIYALYNQRDDIVEEKERKAKAAKYIAQGVALVSSRLSSNGSAKGVQFSALNTSNKTAKYVIMEVVGYNSVDDPVWSDGYLQRCRGIGPIAPGEYGTWNFDNIWSNGGIVDSYEIKMLTIQYTDGTSKSVKLPQRLPSDWRDWLY